ncbi:Malectin-like domain [Dillenia turbinata]|uniref:Malectin-like domain n=1 Tax=Dillenia turbinata TaxID=194707 RepID=A0AAN8VG89_9MAGN
MWQTDKAFIKTGINNSTLLYATIDPLNTLRLFTQQNKNCYTLPAQAGTRYFIRAGFFYGNYDNRSDPPTFDLELEGNEWATVVTYADRPVYNEVIYTSKKDNISTCLVRTKDDQYPFISTLEALPLSADMYSNMSRDLAWFKSYRYSYGAFQDTIGYLDGDKYSRIWEKRKVNGLTPVSALFFSLDGTVAEEPPVSVISYAVEAENVNDSITLGFSLGKVNSLIYVIAYYTEVELISNSNYTRSFNVSVNGQFIATMSPRYKICDATVAYGQVDDSLLTVKLNPTTDSSLAPIISAIEVYTASDSLTAGTSQDDGKLPKSSLSLSLSLSHSVSHSHIPISICLPVEGLGVFVSTFEQLEGWSGDPCLPNNSVWQWLACSNTDTPRVTAINLSRYGLDGSLPNFSQMQALQTIDFGGNSLDGHIPDFIGNLPHLVVLNLQDNNFSGNIPKDIMMNKRLAYNVTGNPHLHNPETEKRKRLALIIGLSVGIPSGVLLILAVVYFISRRRPLPNKGQIPAFQFGNIQSGSSGAQEKTQHSANSVSVSTNTIKPTPTPVAGNVGLPMNGANTNQAPQATNPAPSSLVMATPDMDMEELNELFQLHGIVGTTGRA